MTLSADKHTAPNRSRREDKATSKVAPRTINVYGVRPADPYVFPRECIGLAAINADPGTVPRAGAGALLEYNMPHVREETVARHPVSLVV
jgi:hypothetical protein